MTLVVTPSLGDLSVLSCQDQLSTFLSGSTESPVGLENLGLMADLAQ